MIFLIMLLLLTPMNVNAAYYTKVDSLQEAQKIAESANCTLVSYDYDIAVYEKNSLSKNSLSSKNLENNNYTLYEDYIAHICRVPYDEIQEETYKDIELLNTYLNNITGKGVTVGIIDTGCNISHSDLKKNIRDCYNVLEKNKNVTDNDGHGTHVAGIVGATDNNQGVMGVAPDCSLYIVKASYKDTGYFKYSDLVKAIYNCIDVGYVDIINLSLCGEYDSPPLKNALMDAKKAGILVVTAAGNDGSSKPVYPAAYQIGLSVTSGSKGKLSYFSNYGINANIIAPGECIYSTYSNGYTYLSGTSMATPIVSGVAALVYSKYRICHNPDIVKNKILSNAKIGSVNVQKIFGLKYIKPPSKPKVAIIQEEPDTLQKMIIVSSSKNTEVYYRENSGIPTKEDKYADKNRIYVDKSGYINIIAVKRNSRAYSKRLRIKVVVNKNALSHKFLKSLYIKGKKEISLNTFKQLLLISKKYKRVPDPQKVKWSSSNSNILSVDKNGKITSYGRKGKVTITAKFGYISKKIHIIVR